MSQKKLPTIFERLFLSHLTLLALTCIVFVWLYLYLLGPELQIVMQHNPVVIIPASLLLLVLAGIISTWTSRTLAQPIEQTTHALKTAGNFDFAKESEEINSLIVQIESLGRRRHGNTIADGEQLRHAQSTISNDAINNLKQAIGALANSLILLMPRLSNPDDSAIIERMREQIIKLTYETTRLATQYAEQQNT